MTNCSVSLHRAFDHDGASHQISKTDCNRQIFILNHIALFKLLNSKTQFQPPVLLIFHQRIDFQSRDSKHPMSSTIIVRLTSSNIACHRQTLSNIALPRPASPSSASVIPLERNFHHDGASHRLRSHDHDLAHFQ